MKELPIIFSRSMVSAILEGRKTQTRRIVKIKPDDLPYTFIENGEPRREARHGSFLVPCPYGVAGDRLWVRETFAYSIGGAPGTPDDGTRIAYYRASWDDKSDGRIKWRPSIHMPRWASRITLEITKVRVERLQEISEEDAIAEGAMEWWNSLSHSEQTAVYNGGKGPVAAFSMLWDSLHGKGAWEKNPWVWVIEFERDAK